MSDLSYLETLSNSQLRAKCIQYSLPNIPITDSSRKVMLRRLRNVMLGMVDNGKKSSATSRCQITDYNVSPKTKPKLRVLNRINNNANNGNNDKFNNVINGNDDKVSNTGGGRTKVITTTLSDAGSQSEEEEINYNLNRAQRKTEQPLLRRSVSLSKTGVLTTSYTQEVSPVHTYLETDKMASEDEDLSQNVVYKTLQKSVDSRPLPIYEPHINSTSQTNDSRPILSQTQTSPNTYGFTSNNNAVSRNAYTGSSAPSGNYSDLKRTVAIADSSPSPSSANLFGSELYKRPIETASTFDESPVYRRNSCTTNVTNMPPSASPIRREDAYGVSNIQTRPALSKPTEPKLYPNLDGFYDESVEEIDDSTDSEIVSSMKEPPFMSKYTRGLNSSQRIMHNSKPQGRRSLKHVDSDEITESFTQFVSALERKYHLKQSFTILMIFVIMIFIYVMLTPVK